MLKCLNATSVVVFTTINPNTKRKITNTKSEKETVCGKSKMQTDWPKEFFLMNSLLRAAFHFNENQ